MQGRITDPDRRTDEASVSPSDGRVDYKSQVLQATDIVDLIGRSVALKRRGKDFVGLCPFHSEKSPSFHVSPARQFFHCYGCKEGGNAIDFVMKRDRVEFLDALKALGQIAGIEMPRFGASKQKAGERQALLEANSAAGAFFERVLADPAQGAAARAYLQERGFTAETVGRFQVGLAPAAWDGLLKGPVGRKFTPPQLVLAGLAKARENGGGFYDTFRNRLMFPIKDREGRIIAFGGRVMPGTDDKPKYLNSPETPLFSKKNSIFGIDLARQKIIESRTAVIVEGYTDVVMAHQYGATNVVSPLGTAMTEEHVKMLRSFADRLVLLFDADEAGDVAVDRSVGLFLTQQIEIAIASLPDGVDPDEYLLKEGAGAFEKLIAAAPDALTYKWKRLAKQFNAEGGDLTGQQKAVEQYLDLLAAARGSGPVDALRWGAALSRVSRLTDIPVDQLNRRFRNVKPQPRPAAKVAENGPAAGGEPVQTPPPAPKRPLLARDRAERWILGILLAAPERWAQAQKTVGVEDFSDDGRRRLADVYWNYQRDEGLPVFNEFLGLLGDSALQELAIAVLDEVEALPDLSEALAEAVRHLEEERQTREAKKLQAAARRTDPQPLGEQDEVELIRQLQEAARRPNLRRV